MKAWKGSLGVRKWWWQSTIVVGSVIGFGGCCRDATWGGDYMHRKQGSGVWKEEP